MDIVTGIRTPVAGFLLCAAIATICRLAVLAEETTGNELDPYFQRANILFIKKDYKGAIAEWQKVLTLEPENQAALRSIQIAEEKLLPPKPKPPKPRKPLIRPRPKPASPIVPGRPPWHRSLHPFAQFDRFLVTDADETWKEELASLPPQGPIFQENEGFIAHTDDATGGRIGIMKDFRHFDVGLSAGQIVGPSADIATRNNSFPFGSFGYYRQIRSSFTRFLLEAKYDLPVSGWLILRLGAGAGMAFGKLSIGTSPRPGYPAYLDTVDDSWEGPTWEISPTAVIRIKKIGIEFGFRYAHFPENSGTVLFSEFEWNPIGYFVGVSL